MSFILDTDTCSAHMRRRPDLTSRFIQYGQLSTTTVNAGELFAWAYKQHDPRRMLHQIDLFLASMNIFPYDLDAANIFGECRGKLLKKGIVVARVDLMIAAIALQHNFTLITHNTKDFENIPGLRLEDWLA